MARRKRKRVQEEKPSEPPMTPMIDVIFQLLIFFVLTMQFKSVEGRLLSQLPKTKGMDPTVGPPPPLEEIRITVCCNADVEEHLNDKGRHDKKLQQREQQELSAGKLTLNEKCGAWVERLHAGTLIKCGKNSPTYRDIARKVKELLDLMPRASLVLDADSAVPYEHVIGIVNALKEVGIQNVEFAANPRHMPR